MLVKDGNPAAADQVLTGLQSDSPVTALQAVLMRAQIAVNNENQAQVSSDMGNDNKSASASVITSGTLWVRGNSDLSGSPCQRKSPFSVSGGRLLFEGIPFLRDSRPLGVNVIPRPTDENECHTLHASVYAVMRHAINQ